MHPNAMLQRQYLIMKELFAEHGIPGYLCTDNGPQFANALSAEFATEWKFDHNTSAPMRPRSNGQAEAAMKIVKGLLTHAKCSGPSTLLAHCSTPIDAHLCSLTKLLYPWALHNTVPHCIWNTDPHAATE